MALRECSSAHCSGADAEINEVCREAGWPINHPVITRDENGPCRCSCSCLAFGTMVQDGSGSFKAIEQYVVGDEVMAAGTNLDFKPQRVVFSGGTTGASRQKFTVVVVYASTAIAVTSDHLFLLAGGNELRRADRLTIRDKLVGPDGKSVAIKSVHIGDYLAGFHHVSATSTTPPDQSMDGHLLNTNGVVSADYTVQIMARVGDVAGFMADVNKALPIVGSPDYVKAHGDASLKAPELAAGFEDNGNFRTQTFNAPDDQVPSNTFIPAEAIRISVPAAACSFLSTEEAERKKASPKRPFNDPQAREVVEAVIQFHKTFYPHVNYSLDWVDDEVNAYAWVENGVRHVSLKGGLVRDADLDIEGIAVVLAHELAHHFGGPPLFPSGLSCEGQADYRGVRDIMRKVWFGDSYSTTTQAGIAQMAAFFGVADSADVPTGSAGCSHPPGNCRIATYHAAVMLTGKPGCAS